jgi:DNA-binding response OmpR family regulator
VDSILAIGDLSIDTVNKKVYFENHEVILTSREYAILEYLVYNKGSVITRQMIEDHVWGYDSEAYSNVVAVLVMRIRKKLCPNNKEKVITTARGFGYVIQDP